MTPLHTDATPEQRAATHTPGDVFQITNPNEGNKGWLGAFVLATKVGSWGIRGLVHRGGQPSHSMPLPWQAIEYIGRAKLMPEG